MTSSARVRALLAGGLPDRVPICDTYWAATLARWRGEGLPTDVAPEDHFGLEWCKLTGDYTLRWPVEPLAETARHRRLIDANGVTQTQLLTTDGWTPHWEAFRIASAADFERHRERWAYHEDRLPADLLEHYQQARARGRAVFFAGHGCFHGTWAKIGQVQQYLWMIEQPGLIGELFAAHTQLIADLYDGLRRRGVEFDGAFLADDLGSTRSPLIAPAMYRALVQPHHARLTAHFARDGVGTILHSDGNVAPLIDDFLDAGFRGLHPLEAKAGLDVGDLRRRYGARLVLFGNVDVRALAAGPEQAAREVRETVLAAKDGGGYLFHSDHSVPADVPLANYRRALEVAREWGAWR